MGPQITDPLRIELSIKQNFIELLTKIKVSDWGPISFDASHIMWLTADHKIYRMDEHKKDVGWWEISFDDSFNVDTERHSLPNRDAEVEFCIHEWIKYEGFTEVYDYCKKCDTKNK